MGRPSWSRLGKTRVYIAQKRALRAKAFVGATGTYLHGIGADDLAGEPLGQLDGQLGLPGAGGPENNHQRHPRPHLVAGSLGCHYHFIQVNTRNKWRSLRADGRARQPFESCEFSHGLAGGLAVPVWCSLPLESSQTALWLGRLGLCESSHCVHLHYMSKSALNLFK
jgi:hypothetical protein